jgi:hypothetical protein
VEEWSSSATVDLVLSLVYSALLLALIVVSYLSFSRRKNGN